MTAHPQMFLWIMFTVFVLVMLFLDLFVFHRKAHTISIKESLIWSVVWVLLALAFNIGIYYFEGLEKALNFFTGYVIERSLSLDNIFVFLLIFRYFKVPAKYQHGVLFWGVFGAFVIRALFIVAGVSLITRFHWIIYVFGALLVWSGIKMALEKDKEIHPEHNPLIKLLRRYMPIAHDYDEDKFFTRKHGTLMATPLFVVLLVMESTDVIFAVDSIPAILAITTDPFIVYSSNVFAILGLRALYFALAAIMDVFCYLHYGLSAILVFVGIKMLVASFLHIPVFVTLIVVVCILMISIVASIGRKTTRKGDSPPPGVCRIPTEPKNKGS